jgi:hypothetical protein
METNQFHRAEPSMANSHRRTSTGASSPIANLAWLAACLLILLGLAFELGMLGFGPYNSSDVWLYSVIGRNAWIMLSDLVIPQLRELVKMWPVMLVSLGSAILLIAQRRRRIDAVAAPSSMTKENNGN